MDETIEYEECPVCHQKTLVATNTEGICRNEDCLHYEEYFSDAIY